MESWGYDGTKSSTSHRGATLHSVKEKASSSHYERFAERLPELHATCC